MRKSLFRRTRPWLMLLTGGLFSIVLAACGGNATTGPHSLHTTLNTYGPVAGDENVLFFIILIIAAIVFLGVEAALVYSIIRYRERPGMPTPRQNHGNIRIEVLWTIIPAVILFIVLGFTIQTLFAVSTQPAGNTVDVEAVGHQWWWEFYYPQYHITTADSLYAPVNTVVHVDLFSNNVIHSFWIPALTGKTDDIPGHDNQKWFKADKTGTYYGECAEFCGTQHAHMAFDAVIYSPDEFTSWVHTQQQAAATPTSGSLAAQGKALFNSASIGCAGCHGIIGTNVTQYYDPKQYCADNNIASLAVECKVGPNLTHFASRELIAGGVLIHNRSQCLDPNNLSNCNLAKWLANPQGIKPGSDMVLSQPLTSDQVKALVAYLETLQ